MSLAPDMTVSLRLPTQSLYEAQATALTAVASDGAFGILPNHIDFVTAIVPSVLTLCLTDGTEEIFGVDEGLLVKKGHLVSVSVRRGVHGDNLASLQDLVEARFVQMDEEERQARSALSRLEADLVRRFAELKRPQP
ncbi:ATPase [Phaeobacter sp. B1627]|uniref:ATPase n=1 Tax=Phaeobacter sp. B1627 TaxID=2583809 RepID=UPI00111A252E|nr:ATPase [Phaeobacter sp. B1627]TNJ43315.1 ATPase [Phaeobacter sp. B1627]